MKNALFFILFFFSFTFLLSQTVFQFSDMEDEQTSVLKENLKNTNSDLAVDMTAKRNSVILWDNTNINLANSGTVSCYWSGSSTWTWCADDFDADNPWIIEKITSKGFSNSPSVLPTHMAIAIFENDEVTCKPGLEIFRNTAIPVSNAADPVIILPEPFQLPAPGKYWIAIAGVYNATIPGDVVAENRWNIRWGTAEKGCRFKLFDQAGAFPPSNTWRDGSATGASLFFMIEGEAGVVIDCESVKNLKAEYIGQCEKAEITWTAPTKGDFKYFVYRDGEEIATVETEFYSDVTFEPTLAHAWDVIVDCDGYSPPERVTLEACKEPDCSQRPKELSVKYQEDCSAQLKWYAPTEVYWDNVKTTNTGHKTGRWMMDEFSRYTWADDFDVTVGETWIISEVFLYGFYNAMEPPDFIGIEFWDDNGSDMPGNMIYEEPFLIPMSGVLTGSNTILLPEPMIFSTPGKYWISYYGTHDKDFLETRWWYAGVFAEQIGAPFVHWDESSGNGWVSVENSQYASMYFRLQGPKSNDPIYYNVYRDGVVIAPEITNLDFKDVDFEFNKSHTWAVKTICPNGGESAPVYLTLPPTPYQCSDLKDKESVSFIVYPNPSTSTITIIAENAINKIEVINLLGQTVFSQSNIYISKKIIDLSYLHNGIYFIRVFSETGTSIQKFVKQ